MAAIRIGEMLVQEGLITAAQLRSALTAQQIFGGKLGTNLVESGFVNELDLARLLSRQLGIPMVGPDDLADLDANLVALIPRDVARKYAVVAFHKEAGTGRIALAMADPGNLQKIDEIQFALGNKIDFHICPEVMLAHALEKYYGVERSRRYIRVSGFADAELRLHAEDRPATGVSRPPSAGTPARAEILGRIIHAQTKRDLVQASVDLLGNWCGEIVFFVLSGETLMAWDVRGPSVRPEALRGASLPLASSPLLTEVLDQCTHHLVPSVEDPGLARLLGSLGVSTSGPTFLLPLIVNRKGFGLAVMAGLPAGFDAEVPLLVELMKRVGYKLQIFFLTEYLSAPL